MARKSKWAQFTDNFNGVYGTFNKIGKDIESTKVMNNDFEDADGNALGGDALDRRRMQELSKVYTKYGDTKGGLDLRAQQAKIESDKRANDLGRDTYDALVEQNGLLKTQQMIAQNANTNASTGNINSTTSRRDALLPGEVDQQGATLDGTNASTANTVSTTSRRDALLPGEVDQQGATLDGTNASTANTTSTTARRDGLLTGEIEGQDLTNTGKGLDNQGSAIDVDIKDATSASTIESTNASNDATTSASKFADMRSTMEQKDYSREENLLTSIMGDDSYTTAAEAQAAYKTAIMNDDTIPFERRNQILAAVDKMGLEALTGESAKLAAGAQSALQKGGMDGLVEYYDTIDDGDTMRIDRNDDGTVSIVAVRGDEETVMFTADGEDAETVVTQQMFNQISRPGTGMEVAAAALDMKETRANTDLKTSQASLVDSQKFSEILSQDTEQARTVLVTAQADKTRAEIEQLGVGLKGAEKIHIQGLADIQESDAFVMMGQMEGGAELQANTLANYMRVMGMKDAPPSGIDAIDWFDATDEEKQALSN